MCYFVYLFLSSGDHFVLSIRVSPFNFYFCAILINVTLFLGKHWFSFLWKNFIFLFYLFLCYQVKSPTDDLFKFDSKVTKKNNNYDTNGEIFVSGVQPVIFHEEMNYPVSSKTTFYHRSELLTSSFILNITKFIKLVIFCLPLDTQRKTLSIQNFIYDAYMPHFHQCLKNTKFLIN